MRPSELKDLIKARIENKIKRSILIESSPGLGKTQIASQVASELGIEFKAIHAPLLQPEDYGFPVITADKKDVDFVVSKDKFPLEKSPVGDKGILLIDELSQADNSAQKIIANLIQEREIHGKKLKPDWYIVATGNRQSDRSGANRILNHLGNRVTRVSLDVSLDDWTQWALNNNVKTEVIAFLRYRPDLLSNFDANQEVNATPRSWVEGVSESLGNIKKSLEFEVFKGDVGEGPASEFLSFLKIYRELPNPDTILMNPKKAEIPTNPATLYALCGALAHRVTPTNFDRAIEYIKRLPTEKSDFGVLFIKLASAKNPDVCTTKGFIDWVSSTGIDLIS